MIAFQSEILKNNLGLSLDQLRQFPIIESHPEYKHITDMPVAPLKTTGTSDNRAKSYWYPEKEYALIQRYHFERLMYVNNIQFGNAVRLVPKGFFENSKKLGLHKCPFDVAMSYSNVTWYAVYPPYNEQSDEFWISLFFSIYQLKPQLVYCSPSELELFADLPIRKPNCPVIVSGETLYPHVRKKVSKIFTSVIDKMRCWDGGLSFFECPFGRKHINDELAVVEKINDVLVSTDLFNVSHNFIRYSNGDSGDIEEGMCQCGIYGKYFSKFDGRTVECLVASDGRIIPGNTVVSRILRTCKQRQSLSFRQL